MKRNLWIVGFTLLVLTQLNTLVAIWVLEFNDDGVQETKLAISWFLGVVIGIGFCVAANLADDK